MRLLDGLDALLGSSHIWQDSNGGESNKDANKYIVSLANKILKICIQNIKYCKQDIIILDDKIHHIVPDIQR